MNKSRVIIGLLLAFILLLSVPCFAQSRFGIQTSRPVETTGILTDRDGNTMDYEVWVYGISIYADAASSFMGVYDCDTTAELVAATIYPEDEIGEATQYDTATVWYEKPVYYSDGVGVIMTTGVGFVHYGGAPTN